MKEPSTKPFKALIYNKDIIDDIGLCVCPPYDVITDRTLYLKRNDYNIIRLELPESEPPLDKYETAKKTLESWIEKDILIEDKEEGVYIYEQKFYYDGKDYIRIGFVALNRIGDDRVFIHEATRVQAKQDREMLISTLKTFTSFIFGLYEDEDGKIEDLLVNSHKTILFSFTDENSVENKIYKLSNVSELDELSRLMEDKKIYIADGHHRLEVSYKLRLNYIPIYLTNMYSPSLIIWPYHRIIKFKKQKDFKWLLNILNEYGEVKKSSIRDKNDIKNCIELIKNESKPTYAFYSKDDTDNVYVIKLEREVSFTEEIPQVLKQLKVNILHSGILNNLLGIKEEEISFTQDALQYIDKLKEGNIDLIVFLPPTTVYEVKAVADNRLFMPPKSTFFYPKITTGPIIYRL